MYKYLCLLVSCLLLAGCSSSSKPVSFLINDTSYEHIVESSDYLNKEEYNGSTTIVTSKPTSENYIVLVKATRIKGGNMVWITDDKLVLVCNGKGELTTSDLSYSDSGKLIKPEYKFEIKGYIPFTKSIISKL